MDENPWDALGDQGSTGTSTTQIFPTSFRIFSSWQGALKTSHLVEQEETLKKEKNTHWSCRAHCMSAVTNRQSIVLLVLRAPIPVHWVVKISQNEIIALSSWAKILSKNRGDASFNPLHESTNQGPSFRGSVENWHKNSNKCILPTMYFPPASRENQRKVRPVPQHAVPFQGSCCALGLATSGFYHYNCWAITLVPGLAVVHSPPNAAKTQRFVASSNSRAITEKIKELRFLFGGIKQGS